MKKLFNSSRKKGLLAGLALTIGVVNFSYAKFMGQEVGGGTMYNCGGCPVSVREVTTYVFWIPVESHFEYDSPCLGSGTMDSAGCP